MKKIIYISGIIAAMLFSTNTYSYNLINKKENKAFYHSFHHAKNVHRFDKANGITEYDFLMKGKYVAAFYDQTGNLIETDFSIAFKDLPEKTKGFINSEFSNPVITDITRVVHKQNTFYKIQLESNGVEYSIAVTPSGQATIGY
jgi:hypothetical protein